MIPQSHPPILLRDVIDDVGDVERLLKRNAPYTPLGGWYRPGADLDAPTSPMWFRNDWVHADLRVEGSELFLFHERVTQAARDFYDAEVVLPCPTGPVTSQPGYASSSSSAFASFRSWVSKPSVNQS